MTICAEHHEVGIKGLDHLCLKILKLIEALSLNKSGRVAISNSSLLRLTQVQAVFESTAQLCIEPSPFELWL